MSEALYIIVTAAPFLLVGALGVLLGHLSRKRAARPQGVGEERRSTVSSIDEAKFSTQKNVTYILLGIFIGVAIQVMLGTDQAERSTILQTVINLTLLAVGYWLGASKAAADSGDAMSKIIKPQAEAMSRMIEQAPKNEARAVAAARGPAPEEPVAPTETAVVTPTAPNPDTGVIPAAEVVQPKEPKT